MYVLHVDLKVRLDAKQTLEEAYREIFRPAISSQPGFDHVQLLEPERDEGDHRLVIAFQDEAAQKKWVATDLHREVWPKIEAHCSSYEVEAFHEA